MDDKTKARVKAKVKKWRANFLRKWDGKCSICGKPVEKRDLFPDGMPDSINGAVIGKYFLVMGHPTCVQNVDKIVVIPNRMRAALILSSHRQ